MPQSRFKKNQRGIGLIEVIASLGISVVVITSLVSLTLFTLRNSLYSTLQLEGTKIVTQQMELVRAYRDGSSLSWVDFVNDVSTCNSTNPCHMDANVARQSGKETIGEGAKQVVYYFTATQSDGTNLQPPEDLVRITCTAEWVIGGQTKKTHVYTDLTNWQNK